MGKFIVFGLFLALGSLASAQIQQNQCDCNRMTQCVQQKHTQKQQMHANCEQRCIPTLGANAGAVQGCFQQKTAQMMTKPAHETCVINQALCSGAGRKKRHFQLMPENADFIEEDREKRNAGMQIPEMQPFENCMRNCTQQQGQGSMGSMGSVGGHRGGGGGALNACAVEQNCILNDNAISMAKQSCMQQKQSQPFDQNQHQQGCICLRNAFRKSEAEMPCNAGPRMGGRPFPGQ